ncbi:MAG: hypothetical protein WCT49_03380 [Candidatus Paceibacterota bacterium]|jgi:hypothetical protein|nr:hypothetical protein [Candidatus Paceibacterota bacterium]
MDTLKRGLRLLTFLLGCTYLLLILANIIALLGAVTPTHFNMLLETDFFSAVSLIPFFLLIDTLGVPMYQKCDACGSRAKIRYRLKSGNDASNPDKYEHFFDVEECLFCKKKDVHHVKSEKRCPPFRRW